MLNWILSGGLCIAIVMGLHYLMTPERRDCEEGNDSHYKNCKCNH